MHLDDMLATAGIAEAPAYNLGYDSILFTYQSDGVIPLADNPLLTQVTRINGLDSCKYRRLGNLELVFGPNSLIVEGSLSSFMNVGNNERLISFDEVEVAVDTLQAQLGINDLRWASIQRLDFAATWRTFDWPHRYKTLFLPFGHHQSLEDSYDHSRYIQTRSRSSVNIFYDKSHQKRLSYPLARYEIRLHHEPHTLVGWDGALMLNDLSSSTLFEGCASRLVDNMVASTSEASEIYYESKCRPDEAHSAKVVFDALTGVYQQIPIEHRECRKLVRRLVSRWAIEAEELRWKEMREHIRQIRTTADKMLGMARMAAGRNRAM
ncbi:MAG TPA: hypothetical protein VEF04_03475 [Blastocatellia bacterium]|nr:hypothetical protein [Blastocatellia bacterium]